MLAYFLSGAVFMAALVSALFFLRFWRDSCDRFFLFFALALALLGLERIPILVRGVNSDTHYSVYIIRICAYLLILTAIGIKNLNRQARSL